MIYAVPRLIKEMLKIDKLLYFKLKTGQTNIDAHVDSLDMMAVLESIEVIQKITNQQLYMSDADTVAKMNIKNTLQVPYAIHLSLQVFFYASMSSLHLKRFSDAINSMSQKHLLTFDRLLIMICNTGDLVSRDHMLKIVKASKIIKKTKQLCMPC